MNDAAARNFEYLAYGLIAVWVILVALRADARRPGGQDPDADRIPEAYGRGPRKALALEIGGPRVLAFRIE
jgi:hypothetical protein